MSVEGDFPSIRDLEEPVMNGMKRKFYRTLEEFEDALPESTFLRWCANTLAEGTSLRTISTKVGVSHGSLGRFLRAYYINVLTQSEASRRVLTKLHEDPEFTARAAAAGNEASQRKWGEPGFRERRSEEVKKQWEDPKFRDLVSNTARLNVGRTILNPAVDEKRKVDTIKANTERWANPEYRRRETARLREITLTNWADPDFREKQSQKMLHQWEDLGFRKRHSDRNSTSMSRRWEDPEYRELNLALLTAYREDPHFKAAHIERMHQRWIEDEDYRKTVAKALRKAMEERIKEGSLPLSSIHGLRRDLGFYPFSTWEANLARIFDFTGWLYDARVPFELQVPNVIQRRYKMPTTSIFHVDFITLNPRGNIRANEIMVHPSKNPIGWVKVGLFREQYPDIPLRLISNHYYDILEARFRRAIDTDARFCGWETKDDNLYTNPDKFAA